MKTFVTLWITPFIAWLILGTVIAKEPNVQFPAMILVCVILAIKALSIVDAIRSIWALGAQVAIELRDWERQTDFEPEKRRLHVYDRISQMMSHFGRWDWKLMAKVQRCKSTEHHDVCAILVQFARNVFYRFEALMVLAAILFVFQPYPVEDTKLRLSILTAFGVIINIALMATEVMVGNVIMGPGYDRYYHRHLEIATSGIGVSRQNLLRSVKNFARLALFSFLAISAVLQGVNACEKFEGFKGISAYKCKRDEAKWNTPDKTTRLLTFGEFAAFTLTTFATVGYGDTYPVTPIARLTVGCLHVLGMGMVLVLLQLMLYQKGWPIDENVLVP